MSDKRRANGEGTFIVLGNGKLLLKKGEKRSASTCEEERRIEMKIV